jgi:Transcriptional regulators
MTAYLIAHGHTRIGFIKGHPNQTASARRHEGFSSSMISCSILRVIVYFAHVSQTCLDS